MGYLSPTPVPPRTHEIPGAVAERLSTSRMDTLLYGTDRIYTQQSEPERPDWSEGSPGGRIVVMTADRAFPGAQVPATRAQAKRVLVKKGVSHPGAGGFDPLQALEALFEEELTRLAGWKPTLTKASVGLGFFWRGPVNERPFRADEWHGLWVRTDEWRVVITPA